MYTRDVYQMYTRDVYQMYTRDNRDVYKQLLTFELQSSLSSDTRTKNQEHDEIGHVTIILYRYDTAFCKILNAIRRR